ncbi:hypothetical protein HaLaN_28160, partial [Haematococcus lacustris]
MELNEALGAKALLDRTCGLAQSQLSSTQQELVHRVNELTEKNSYLSSVLEAKEASIQSLHQLLRAKQAMAEASEADSQQLRKLRSRVLELETQGIEQAKQIERDVARDQAQGMALQQAEAQLRAVAQERAVLQEQFQL